MTHRILLVLLLLILLITACQGEEEPLPTLRAVATFTPSDTPAPLSEVAAQASPVETATPLSEVAAQPSPIVTATPLPIDTAEPLPIQPSATLTLTLTLTEVAELPTATDTATTVPSDSPIPSETPSETPSATLTETQTNTPTETATATPTEALPTATEFIQIATDEPTAVPVSDTGDFTIRVSAQNLNIRNGPSDSFDVVAHLSEGAVASVLGTDEQQEWFLIEYDQGRRGWVYQGFVELNGDLALVPDMHPTPLPDFVRLTGLTHIWQAFNNCAPTAVTMALTYYGGSTDTTPASEYLRPSYNRDVSVDIGQMVQYINDEVQGIRAVWRMGGNWTTIRQLVAAGFPVIIETSVQVGAPDPGWAGHNRVIIGYDGDDTILAYDSYLGSGNGQGYRINKDELDEDWRHMNRNFMVIYPIEDEQEVAYLMGEDWSIASNIDRSTRIAEAEMAANPSDVFALFNLGTTYTALGRYEEAAAAFDLAFDASQNGPEQIPFRIFWYQFSIFDAYYHMGRYAEVIDHARRALNNMGGNGAEELYYWLGMGYAGRGQFDQAKAQFENALSFNPHFEPAETALEQIVTGTFQPPM